MLGLPRLDFPGMSADLGECSAFAMQLATMDRTFVTRSGVMSQGSRTMYPRSLSQGAYSPGIDQEFYGGIIVTPTKLDMGLVLSSKLFTIGVWNLTGYDQQMSSWSVDGLDGVTISNVDGYPVRYGPGAFRSYQVTVGTQGQAVIAGAITFHFDGINTGAATAVTGSRLIIFSFEPNWREAPVENLEWLTDVLTSHNGSEQRLALRQNPRRSMKYLYTFESQNKVNLCEGLLWGWQQRVFCVPVWTDWQYLSAPLSIGATSVAVPTPMRDFATSNLVLLWRDYLTWEVVEVQSLTATTITLKKATLNAWKSSDRIVPLRLGRTSKNLQLSRPTSTIAEASITFSFEVPDQVDANRLGSTSWLQFGGLDVLTTPPNAATELDEAYERDIETVDYDKGAWFSQCNTSAPVVSRPYAWLLRTRQEIASFLAFLETRRGKHVPFWMPTWGKDVEILQALGAVDKNILVKNIGYTRYIKLHTNRSKLIFFPSDGSTPIIKTITGSVESANNTEIISLDSNFGVAKNPSDFKAISFLTFCRFDQDAFELTWHTDSIMEVSTRVREVLQ